MSDNKLKSEDGTPASGKDAEKKTPAETKPKAESKKSSTSKSKATATNRKVKKAATSSQKTPETKPADKKASDAKSSPASKAKSSSAKKKTAKTTAVKPEVKKSDAKKSGSENKKSSTEKEAQAATDESKAKTKSAPLSAKHENAITQKPRKVRSFAKMITLAAVLFLGVLFVFLKGSDPIIEEEQTASNTPAAKVEDPNPNASSPYGMRVEQLKEIETLLANLNLDPGNIDGDIDHEAVAAISLFQEISGLEVDGRPSPDLLVDLKAVEKLLKVE